MARVRLSSSAERWFLKRISDLSQQNPQAAFRLIERFERQLSLLSSFPRMTEPGLIAGTRKVSLPPLILTVRIHGDSLDVVAIRDARQGDALSPRDIKPDVLPDDF